MHLTSVLHPSARVVHCRLSARLTRPRSKGNHQAQRCMSVSENMLFLLVLAGFLDRLAFHKAMDLISIAQQGKEITR